VIGVATDDPRDGELGAIEQFFATAGVDPAIELASWCSEGLLQRMMHHPRRHMAG
jgi:hypothetical protein